TDRKARSGPPEGRSHDTAFEIPGARFKSQPHTVSLRILDNEYPVACPPAERYNPEEAARHLDATMRVIRSRAHLIGLERIAVMAALNISHEMLLSKRQQQQLSGEQQQQINELNQRLDQALARHQE